MNVPDDVSNAREGREPVETVNGRVRALIRRKGMRMGWVADQLGISASLLSLRLSGQRRWPLGFEQRLADVLCVPVSEVTG